MTEAAPSRCSITNGCPSPLLEPIRQRARDGVGVAAGGIGQDDGDGLRRDRFARCERRTQASIAAANSIRRITSLRAVIVAVATSHHCDPAMPACCTTLPQRAISDFTNACKSATVGVAIGSMPVLATWPDTSGVASCALSSACSLSTIGARRLRRRHHHLPGRHVEALHRVVDRRHVGNAWAPASRWRRRSRAPCRPG